MSKIEVISIEVSITHQIQCVDITDEAKYIFGEFVEKAYIALPKWAEKDDVKRASSFTSDSSIEPDDGYPVYIGFTNGKGIKLSISEWGGIYSTTEDEYLKDIIN